MKDTVRQSLKSSRDRLNEQIDETNRQIDYLQNALTEQKTIRDGLKAEKDTIVADLAEVGEVDP